MPIYLFCELGFYQISYIRFLNIILIFNFNIKCQNLTKKINAMQYYYDHLFIDDHKIYDILRLILVSFFYSQSKVIILYYRKEILLKINLLFLDVFLHDEGLDQSIN